jgi:hypothetical protein
MAFCTPRAHRARVVPKRAGQRGGAQRGSPARSAHLGWQAAGRRERSQTWQKKAELVGGKPEGDRVSFSRLVIDFLLCSVIQGIVISMVIGSWLGLVRGLMASSNKNRPPAHTCALGTEQVHTHEAHATSTSYIGPNRHAATPSPSGIA